MSKFELVKTRKISFDLPVLIIYNPSSGRSANILPLILTTLKLNKISYELLETKQKNDTYFFAKDADLTKYSMLVSVGGDGSYHEVVNGMLARPDKLKIPVSLLPNGSGNDTCRSIGIKNLDDALDYLIKGEVIALDTIRCMIDCDSFD